MNHKGVACSALGAMVDTAAGAGAWLYVGTVMVWILASPYPALQDYPEWLYQGYVVAALFKGSPGAAAAFEFARYPIPNSLTQIMLGLLNLVVSPLVAGKIWLCAYLISFMVVLTVIARSVHPAHCGKLLLVLTTTTAVGSGFWNGYINYQVSLPTVEHVCVRVVSARAANRCDVRKLCPCSVLLPRSDLRSFCRVAPNCRGHSAAAEMDRFPQGQNRGRASACPMLIAVVYSGPETGLCRSGECDAW